MSGNQMIRQFHRWISIGFTLAVTANFVVIGLTPTGEMPPEIITYSPLLPLFLLLGNGLYMFVLPYTAKGRLESTDS